MNNKRNESIKNIFLLTILLCLYISGVVDMSRGVLPSKNDYKEIYLI